MIGYIEGAVKRIEERSIIVLAGGVGYRVFVTEPTITLAHESEMLGLWTYLAVREDAMDLYGFGNDEEREMFEALLKVSGIGPKSAMNILSNTGGSLLRRAIASNDPSYLTKVSGVGKKTAEKIVMELRDKITDISQGDESSTAESEALDALESLGYSIRDTREIVRSIARTEHETGNIVREALKKLGK